MLSNEEMRRWCRAKTRRGQATHLREYDREFSTMAFLRTIGLKHKPFYQWLAEKEPIPANQARMMRRFIEDWEAGWLEFGSDPNHWQRRVLIRRTTPKPYSPRVTLDLTGPAPRLNLVPRVQSTRMPGFPDVTGVLDGRRAKG